MVKWDGTWQVSHHQWDGLQHPRPLQPQESGAFLNLLFGRLPVVYFGYVINLHPHYDTPIEYGYSGYPQSARFLLAKLHFFCNFSAHF
jgi:hypothetical protein